VYFIKVVHGETILFLAWTMLGNSWNTLGILLQDLNSHPALGIMA